MELATKQAMAILPIARKILQIRKQYATFGRGDLTLLTPVNTSILAYVRTYQDETLVLVNNLSRDPQTAVIDLSQYACKKMTDLIQTLIVE